MEPEYKTIEEFAEYLLEDERASFNVTELVALSRDVKKSYHVVRLELESYGFTFERRKHETHARGVSSNDNDRWYGRGADKTSGGSGWEQITGFAGHNG
jgi:hypothetical protein